MKRILVDTWHLLTFRLSPEAFQSFTAGHLGFGLVCTWLVGMGRYWDSPDAGLAQRLGAGSVLYVFALSAILWAVAKPLSLDPSWSYGRVLAYVTLVSPPAALYAIPVERMMPLNSAIEANAWFLGLVAAWRVALLLRLYRIQAGLNWKRAVVSAVLPLALIVFALSALNLERAVFDIMAGRGQATANDGAYAIVLLLTCISVPAAPLFLIAWGVEARKVAWERQVARRQSQGETPPDGPETP